MADEIKSIFDLEEFKPYAVAFQARKTRFARYWRYYKAELTVAGEWATDMGQLLGAALGTAVKPIFTPLARAVELDVALIPGDWKVDATGENQQNGLDRLFDWSKWDCEGDIFVRYATALGEAGLRVVDDRLNKRVLIQPIRPDTYITIPTSAWDTTPRMVISLTRMAEDEIAEVIEPTRIRTYKNGLPYALDFDAGRGAVYANPLGFVPFVVCKLDSGDGAGEPTFDNTLPALDQVNRQATYMATIIQRHAEPQWAVIGAEAGDLEKSGEAVWFFPEGADVKAVLAAVDFAGLLAFIKEIKQEMKDSLPELALSELVGVERIAAATLELQMAEAVFKIRRLRKPCDRALMEAVAVAGKAAQNMGLAELAGLADGTLRFDKNRAVITLDALTRLQIESASQGQEMSRLAMEREKALLATSRGNEQNV